MNQAQGLVVITAERFFSHRRVHELLQAWGEQLRVWDEAVPEGWGWPTASFDPSQQHATAAGAPGSLTLPEACVQRLGQRKANVEIIHRLVQALPLIPHYALKYRYIYELEEDEIGVQIGASLRVVEQSLSSGRNAVRNALIAFKERVALRRGAHEGI